MAEAFFTANLQLPDEEMEVVKNDPSSSSDTSIRVKMEVDGESLFPQEIEGVSLILEEDNGVSDIFKEHLGESVIPKEEKGNSIISKEEPVIPKSEIAETVIPKEEVVEPVIPKEEIVEPVLLPKEEIVEPALLPKEEIVEPVLLPKEEIVEPVLLPKEEVVEPQDEDGEFVLSQEGGESVLPQEERESVPPEEEGESVPPLEEEEESGSDIIIEEERYPSRSSSPDIEVVKVLKSTTAYVVDLIDDDDDDDELEICESIDQSHSTILGRSNASVVDISNEENGYRQPVTMHQELDHLGNSSLPTLPSDTDSMAFNQLQLNPAADFGYSSISSKPNAPGIPVKEEDDTLSLLRDLESIASLPKTSWRSSCVQPGNHTSMQSRHPMPYKKRISGNFSGGMSTESTCRVVSSADDRDKNLILGGTSQVSSSFPDAPLDMSLSSGLSLQKGTTTTNSYSNFPSETLLHRNANTSHTSSSKPAFDGWYMNSSDSVFQKTDSKTPVSTHPNSAFQAVTPSTSGTRIPDVMDLLANFQSTSTQSTSYTSYNPSACNQGDGTFVNSSQNLFYTGSSGTSSQSWENSLHNILTQLSGSFGSQLSSFPASNTDTVHSPYMANPSTSNLHYSEGCKSEPLNKTNSCQQAGYRTSNVLPVLSPNTVVEQVSNVGNSGISNSLEMPSTSQVSTDNASQATGSLLINNPRPPSPEESTTFSCNICLDSVKMIQSSSRNLCSTVCGHVFCSECLQKSLKKKKECPMCRKRLGKKQYHPLFL